MGRYKIYDREPKRGGYDDDQKSGEQTSGGQVSGISPTPSATRATKSVEAIVKSFNAEKGFGFVAVVGGSEAFMHIGLLEAAGHSSVPEGPRVKVRIGQGPKGPEVTEVIEVDPSTASGDGYTGGALCPWLHLLNGRRRVGATTECVGSVKMYNADKGFGLVGPDALVHATTLERGGLSGLTEGQRVLIQIGQGAERPGGSLHQTRGLNDQVNPRAPTPLATHRHLLCSSIP